ncbi:hypothetical protein RW110999_083 [Cyanophage S-RIM4]|nr:hypothetical protein RW110999_083 [Cyanophage S-RIM4]
MTNTSPFVSALTQKMIPIAYIKQREFVSYVMHTIGRM